MNNPPDPVNEASRILARARAEGQLRQLVRAHQLIRIELQRLNDESFYRLLPRFEAAGRQDASHKLVMDMMMDRFNHDDEIVGLSPGEIPLRAIDLVEARIIARQYIIMSTWTVSDYTFRQGLVERLILLDPQWQNEIVALLAEFIDPEIEREYLRETAQPPCSDYHEPWRAFGRRG